MNLLKIIYFLLSLAFIISLWSFGENIIHTLFVADKNNTIHSEPVSKLKKDIITLDNGISLSNNFDGARLNGATLINDSLVSVDITPEISTVKPHPWYGFKIWAPKKQNIKLKLIYPVNITHQSHPRLSWDGKDWNKISPELYSPTTKKIIYKFIKIGTDAVLNLEIGPDTLWVAANEIITTKRVVEWIKDLSNKQPFIYHTVIGESKEGRALHAVNIVNENAEKNIIVLSRQHASEVVGYLAMQSFIETLVEDSQIAKEFRSKYNIYLFPHINPDGAHNGHWRHNSGGVDLNKDWGNSKQPEIKSIKSYIANKTNISSSNLYFSIDFFSSSQDILYTLPSEFKGNVPGLTVKIAEMVRKSSNYYPVIRPRTSDSKKVSAESYLFHQFGSETLAVIIDENSDATSIKGKGKILSLTMMKLMNDF